MPPPNKLQILVRCVASFSFVLSSTRYFALCICSVPALAVRIPPEQICRTSISAGAGAQLSNSGDVSTERQEVTKKQQYNIRLLFKIKHPVLTPAHKSQKRDIYKLF